MTYRVWIFQRIGIDVDEDGENPGDGAALVDLATVGRLVDLPFVPFPGLSLKFGNTSLLIEEVCWINDEARFICEADPIWTQTERAAEDIVESLVAAGFYPVDENHRETEVH